jgi:DNA-binding winged helix-turn-helix (wHTH) protein/tetratricopeptide (TPR) repeat protein
VGAQPEPELYEFAPFRVYPAEGKVVRDGKVVPLAPRAFEILLVLLRNRGRLVTKDALMDAVWPDTAVEMGNLPFNISVLRKALGDAEDHRFIETVPKRGYRFVGLPAPPSRATEPRTLVGRSAERAELSAAAAEAARGRGRLLCITGEPGLGKTTLIEQFVAETSSEARRHVLRGRCSERLAGVGSYLPILEALDDLLGGESAELAASILRSAAPSWDALTRADAAAVEAASPERLKRELVAFCQRLCRDAPAVLIIDDLHWADTSTTDLLCYLGHRIAALPMLILAGYRLSEMIHGGHPFLAVQLELQARGLSRALPLALLGRAEVAEYLDLTFPQHRFDDSFAGSMQERTGGNPLFLVDLLRQLRGQGEITGAPGSFALRRAVPDTFRGLPDSVRAVVERKVAQLDEAGRQLLSAASIQGEVFDCTLLAAAVEQPAAVVEEQMLGFERAHALVERLAERELPDGTLSLRCRFVHALYHDELHGRLSPSRRAALSLAVAHEILRRWGDRADEQSAVLAELFDAGRDFDRAATRFLEAARAAVQSRGYPEATTLAQRGLRALERTVPSLHRDTQEMALQTVLGVAVMSLKGFAAPDVGQAYERALALSRTVGPSAEVFPVLGGLWLYHVICARLDTARELAETILATAEQNGDRGQIAEANQALGITLMDMGDLEPALRHFQASIALQGPTLPRQRAVLYALEPAVGARVGAARVLVPLGRPDTALAHADQGVALARSLGHAPSLAIALNFSAMVRHLRGEPDAAEARATEAVEVSTEHGLAQTLAWGLFWQGWARAERGEPGAIEQMRLAIGACRDSGSRISLPQFTGLLAEALRRAGQPEEALRLLDEALEASLESGDRYCEAELHVWRGRALLALGRTGEAIESLRTASSRARAQGARWSALRASLDWVSALATPSPEARAALEEAFAEARASGEGGELPLLMEARTLVGTKLG